MKSATHHNTTHQNGHSNGAGRSAWRYKQKARDFHAKHGYRPYTMVDNTALEAEMRDANLPKEQRVLAAIRRYAWGNLCEYAVDAMPAIDHGDPEPAALDQQRLGALLSMAASSMSEACGFLRQEGYIKPSEKLLFPCHIEDGKLLKTKEDGFGVNSDSTNSPSPFLRYRESWLQARPELFKTVAELEEERNRIKLRAKELADQIREVDRQVLSAWRDYVREHGDGVSSDSAGVDSDSKVESIVSPAVSVRDSTGVKGDSRISAAASANASNAGSDSLLNLSSSNSRRPSASAASTDSSAVAAAADSTTLSAIIEAFEPYGLIAEVTAAQILQQCREAAADTDPNEVAAVVTELAVTMSPNARSVVSVLLRKVPEFMKGASLQRFRARRAASASRNSAESQGIAEQRDQEIRQFEEREAKLKEICAKYRREDGMYNMAAIAQDPDLTPTERKTAEGMVQRLGRFTQVDI